MLYMHAYGNTNEVVVDYGGKQISRRKDFVWHLFAGKGIEVTIANFLVFRIVIPDHGPQRPYHRALRQNHIQSIPEADLNMDNLQIYSRPDTRTVTGASTPFPKRTGPVYVGVGGIGTGTFGDVDKAVDVSSMKIFARKTFKGNVTKRQYTAEVDRLRSLKHVSDLLNCGAKLTWLRII